MLVPAYFFTMFVRTFTPSSSSGSISDSLKTIGIQLAIAAILFILETLIEIYILVSTVFERQITNTDVELSVIYKMSLLKFLTT